MSEDNFSKDYSSYFQEIENRITEKSNEPKTEKSSVSKQGTRKRKKRFYRVIRVNIFPVFLVFLAVAVAIIGIAIFSKSCGKEDAQSVSKKTTKQVEEKKNDIIEEIIEFPKTNSKTQGVSGDITSECVIFVNNDTNEVVASKNATRKAFPASTTKLMTLLVAVESLDDFEDTYTMSYRITDPLYKQEATVAGFLSGETITMTDLLYGTILPSGGDAAMALAEIVAGSEKEFATLMNKKCRDLGLKNTNFVNCTGLYDANHYTTAEDMVVIMKAVLKNAICKEIISTYKYTTTKTTQHPDGILLENTLFKYMYGTEAENAEIIGGKTGYTGESGYCICSFGKSNSGVEYICVNLKAPTRWPAVYDQINLYTNFAK